MKGLFWVVLLFGVAVAVAVGARHNEGYVLFVLAPYRVEISLNLFIVTAAFLFLAVYGVLRGLALTFALPRRVREWRQRRQRDKAVLVFEDAVRFLFEGRFGQALKKAGNAYVAGTAPGLVALVAARAAQRLGEPEKLRDWLARARADDPRSEAAALMLEAETLINERRFEEALAALARLQGRHIAALRLELRARQGNGDWDGVLRLTRQLAKRDALPVEAVREIRIQAHLANIARRASDQVQLIAYLRALPADERRLRVVLAAGRSLAGLAATEEVQKLIEATLGGSADDWLPELVTIYGQLDGGDQTARIARAEDWLLGHPGDAGLLLALGRMCIRQRLWGKAQSYLDASLSVEETQAAHLELARLCDQLERPDEANRHYRAAVNC